VDIERALELLVDARTPLGRAVSSAAAVVVALAVGLAADRLAARRTGDPHARYYLRKGLRYAIVLATVVALAGIWQAFAGRIGVVLGFATAGLAFALQEVIGALAGFVNILLGRIFRVGDRIQMGGVRGDVIDVTPLRTKIMEIGSAQDDGSWVRGRQYTGRLVTVSNKATFTEPVFNYSAAFEYLWEELTFPVPHEADWREAERILLEEVRRVSSSQGAQAAITGMTQRYPVARADVEPRVFVRATDDWVELSARFVLPLRSARRVKDDATRRILDRFAAAGIRVASTTQDVTVHPGS